MNFIAMPPLQSVSEELSLKAFIVIIRLGSAEMSNDSMEWSSIHRGFY